MRTRRLAVAAVIMAALDEPSVPAEQFQASLNREPSCLECGSRLARVQAEMARTSRTLSGGQARMDTHSETGFLALVAGMELLAAAVVLALAAGGAVLVLALAGWILLACFRGADFWRHRSRCLRTCGPRSADFSNDLFSIVQHSPLIPAQAGIQLSSRWWPALTASLGPRLRGDERMW